MLPLRGPRVELPGVVAAIAALALAWGVIQLRVVPCPVASRRWGPRRFYVGARRAAWLMVIVMALVVVRLILD
jgi:hypothetical protein